MGVDLLLLVASIAVAADGCLNLDSDARYSTSPARQPGQSKVSGKTRTGTGNIVEWPDTDTNLGTWRRPTSESSEIVERKPPKSGQDGHHSTKDNRAAVERDNTRSVSNRFRDICGQAPLNSITGNLYRDRIMNGKAQKYGEWPSFVEILVSANGNISECGGTLVSDRHVLTSAECVHTKHGSSVVGLANPSNVSVYLATNMLSWPAEFELYREAKSICVAKDYSPSTSPPAHDWALIELDEPVEFGDNIQPACLPSESPIQTKGETAVCWTMGAGLTRTHPERVRPEYVQKLQVEQVPCDPFGLNDQTRECYANHDDPRGNICQGDTGGPVLCLDKRNRWTVVALASATVNCTDETQANTLFRYGAIYTNIKTLLKDVEVQCHL